MQNNANIHPLNYTDYWLQSFLYQLHREMKECMTAETNWTKRQLTARKKTDCIFIGIVIFSFTYIIIIIIIIYENFYMKKIWDIVLARL